MSEENKYEINRGDQVFVAIDISGSMNGPSTIPGKTRMELVKERTVKFIADASKIDPDGITLFTFGRNVKNLGNVGIEQSADVVEKINASEGATHTHQVITAMYASMLELRAKGETNNLLGFIITDGEPTGESTEALVADTLRTIANEQTDGEGIGFSFLQVGDDPAAAAFLKNLDDNLGAKFDIVDTKQFETTDFIVAAEGAVLD